MPLAAVGDDGDSAEKHHTMPSGQFVDELLNRESHRSLLALMRLEISRKSSTEPGFFSQGSLLSVILLLGGRMPARSRRSSMTLRATRAAKSS